MLTRKTVQKRTEQTSGTEVHQAAAAGLSGSGGSLPFGDRIQHAFGSHDISGVRAHTDGAATEANVRMGSLAYATGQSVAFRGTPDLFTAAHEAAHIVQQRAGVSLRDGVGESGDRYEQHADAVAARVVQGESAESLLTGFTGGGGAHAIQSRRTGLQLRDERRSTPRPVPVGGPVQRRVVQRWESGDGARAAGIIESATLEQLYRINFQLEQARSDHERDVRSVGLPVALADRADWRVQLSVADLGSLEALAQRRIASLGRAGVAGPRCEGSDAAGQPPRQGAEAGTHAGQAQPTPTQGGATTNTPGGQVAGNRAGLQVRERFRQELDLIPTGINLAGGWLKLRSIRLRLEVYEEQNLVETPRGGERTQVVLPALTRRGTSNTSVGGQVEFPRFRPDEWHTVIGALQARTNFAPTLAMANEGGVMTGYIGIGTFQVRSKDIPVLREVSFECPLRLIERARTSGGLPEFRVLEARPTFHVGPFQIPGFDPFVRGSLEIAVGPNLPKIMEALAARLRAPGPTPRGPSATEPAPAEPAPAEPGSAPAEPSPTPAEPAPAAPEAGAPGGASANGAAEAVELEAMDGAFFSSAGEALIAAGFVAGGVLTIFGSLRSLQQGDEYFRQSSAAVREIESYCASYANAVRGYPPVGPAQERGYAAARRVVQAYMARHHVTEEQAWQVADRQRPYDLYHTAWQLIQGQVRARLRETADRVTGVTPAMADNTIDGTSSPRFFRPRGM